MVRDVHLVLVYIEKLLKAAQWNKKSVLCEPVFIVHIAEKLHHFHQNGNLPAKLQRFIQEFLE